MKDLKFRTPVKCQNGHKSFWHWKHSDVTIQGHKTITYPECSCVSPRRDQWERDGDDQMFIGIFSKDGTEIYDKDIIKIFDTNDLLLVEYKRGAFGYTVYSRKPWSQFISFCDNPWFNFDEKTTGEIEIVGSTHLTPEFIP